MARYPHLSQTRRDFLKIALVMPGAFSLGSTPLALAQGGLRPTPACGDDGDITPSQTAGPFFKPDSPRRASLVEPGMAGTRIVVTGLVLSTACAPIPRALVDFWHADDRGEYDNSGFRLRGHQFTDEAGRYRLETIVPGIYPGRTRHFHVRAQAPNQPVLTTQLYFPGEPHNRADWIFNRNLVMKVEDAAGGGKVGRFNFVLTDQRSRSRADG